MSEFPSSVVRSIPVRVISGPVHVEIDGRMFTHTPEIESIYTAYNSDMQRLRDEVDARNKRFLEELFKEGLKHA